MIPTFIAFEAHIIPSFSQMATTAEILAAQPGNLAGWEVKPSAFGALRERMRLVFPVNSLGEALPFCD